MISTQTYVKRVRRTRELEVNDTLMCKFREYFQTLWRPLLEVWLTVFLTGVLFYCATTDYHNQESSIHDTESHQECTETGDGALGSLILNQRYIVA